MKVIVTGGLGFIGSAVVRHLIEDTDHVVLNVDKKTYAATQGSVSSVANDQRYSELELDIADASAVSAAVAEFQPDGIIHLAAESHVDRSIDGPGEFVRTNVVGTFELLQATLDYARAKNKLQDFTFLHVSTDEVFGALGADDPPFDEHTRYAPTSPYSASKAGSDHLVRAWNDTFGLQTIITNCSNNYGPFHFPEKLIPLMILKANAGSELPVYGAGENVRDWLFVEDHARAIVTAFEQGQPGSTYTIGGKAERSNLEVVEAICDLLDAKAEALDFPRRELIRFVDDRPGHDFRYAINSTKAESELGWLPSVTFEDGLARTVDWYLTNDWWWAPLLSNSYDGSRLGNLTA